MENKTNGLSIGGMVVGIVSLLISFLPCIGVVGAIPALVGLVLSIIGYRSAKDEGGPTGMGITGMILSGLALVIAVGQGTFMAKTATDLNAPMEAETCDEVLAEMEKTVSQLNALEDKGEDTGFGDISTALNAASRMVSIQKAAAEMNCNDDPEFKAKMDELLESVD